MEFSVKLDVGWSFYHPSSPKNVWACQLSENSTKKSDVGKKSKKFRVLILNWAPFLSIKVFTISLHRKNLLNTQNWLKFPSKAVVQVTNYWKRLILSYNLQFSVKIHRHSVNHVLLLSHYTEKRSERLNLLEFPVEIWN